MIVLLSLYLELSLSPVPPERCDRHWEIVEFFRIFCFRLKGSLNQNVKAIHDFPMPGTFCCVRRCIIESRDGTPAATCASQGERVHDDKLHHHHHHHRSRRSRRIATGLVGGVADGPAQRGLEDLQEHQRSATGLAGGVAEGPAQRGLEDLQAQEHQP